VGIVTDYGLEIVTGVRGSRKHNGFSDWLGVGDYETSKRAEIAQCV